MNPLVNQQKMNQDKYFDNQLIILIHFLRKKNQNCLSDILLTTNQLIEKIINRIVTFFVTFIYCILYCVSELRQRLMIIFIIH